MKGLLHLQDKVGLESNNSQGISEKVIHQQSSKGFFEEANQSEPYQQTIEPTSSRLRSEISKELPKQRSVSKLHKIRLTVQPARAATPLQLIQEASLSECPTTPLPQVHRSPVRATLLDLQRPAPITQQSANPVTPLPAIQTTPLPVMPIPQTKQSPRIPVTPLPAIPTMPLPVVAPAGPVTPWPDIPTTPLPRTQPLPLSVRKERSRFQVEQLKVMSRRQQLQYLFLVTVWIVSNVYFWRWWFHSGHIGNPVIYGLMSAALLYEVTILPSMYTFYLGQMRRPKSVNVVEAELAGVVKQVAVISLTVPGSESLEFVKRQMIAMKNIRHPHDSWILVDKEHSPEIQALAEQLGVFYFSRHDAALWGRAQVASWNRPEPPFKAKTKAGNVNSWIDAYGRFYSHFTQLDVDHIPIPSYLGKVLGFFLDPTVKWVQAPSVYGNLETWTARGSAEQEFVLQGPLQMGFFGFSRTPFIIGSHCTYDMSAIREIGGFQPTRAEDHLDTVFLAAQGYQGVFLPEVIAVGDGPENFETYIGQQFAWARSEEHTSELQSHVNLVCRLLLEK